MNFLTALGIGDFTRNNDSSERPTLPELRKSASYTAEFSGTFHTLRDLGHFQEFASAQVVWLKRPTEEANSSKVVVRHAVKISPKRR